jgi:hypothetical protein
VTAETTIRRSRFFVIACDKREAFAQGSGATKQSILSFRCAMDCFAEPVIGRRFAPTRWLAMTSFEGNALSMGLCL